MESAWVLAMQICASLSAAASFVIVVVYNMNGHLQKVSFNKIIYFICSCDLFASLGMALGHPRDDSTKCWVQAIVTNIFPVAGVFWTTILSYMVYMNVYKQSPIDVFSWECYCVCWGTPIILTLLPLTTNSYGYEGNANSGWCFIDERSDSPSWTLTFWVALSFYFWMWGALVLYCGLFVVMFLELRRISVANTAMAGKEGQASPDADSTVENLVISNIRKFAWYPGNVLLCWSLPCIADIMSSRHRQQSSLLDVISDITPTLLGILNVIAFICTNKEVRDKCLILFVEEENLRTKSSVQKQIERFNKSFEVDIDDDF